MSEGGLRVGGLGDCYRMTRYFDGQRSGMTKRDTVDVI